MGLEELVMYLRISDAHRGVKSKMFDYLSERNDVLRVSLLSGDFDFMVTFLKSESRAINESLAELTDTFGTVFRSKVVTSPLNKKIFSRQYLNPEMERGVWELKKRSPLYLDELEERIVELLLRDGSIKRRGIVSQLGLNERAVSYHLSELKRKGILVKKGFTLDLKALERFGCRLLISLASHDSNGRQELVEFLADQVEVTEIREILSPWDYEIDLEILDQENQMRFIDSIYDKFPTGVSEVKILNVVKEKAGKRISVDCYGRESVIKVAA